MREDKNRAAALLCVSFGTSVDSARESIAAVEAALAAAAPERLFARAYTSGIIRRVLAGRGETVPGVAEALEALAAGGVRRVLVQPTHLLAGNEYEKIRREMAPLRGRFAALELGEPLLAAPSDGEALAAALDGAYPPVEGETLVLFGHGTDHAANGAYPALQAVFCRRGRGDVLVGTVEGRPAFSEVRARLAAQGGRRVHLVPLMLVAGDHAANDMAGPGPESWRTRLEAEGWTVRATVRGLGMLPAVQALYVDHLRRALGGREGGHGL